jgi:hypothetical protein|tara:strand:+ start:473 stop:700 length:228 start_codon:yes stop_codon:yes gene_type:complete
MADQSKRILYRQDNGIVAIVIPANNTKFTIEEIAAKDVPTGYKYKIVDVGDVPSDRSFRDAWTVSESDLTDGVGS